MPELTLGGFVCTSPGQLGLTATISSLSDNTNWTLDVSDFEAMDVETGAYVDDSWVGISEADFLLHAGERPSPTVSFSVDIRFDGTLPASCEAVSTMPEAIATIWVNSTAEVVPPEIDETGASNQASTTGPTSIPQRAPGPSTPISVATIVGIAALAARWGRRRD